MLALVDGAANARDGLEARVSQFVAGMWGGFDGWYRFELVNEIAAGSPDEEFYDAKVIVLKEQIEHHVKEEEKQHENMFQQARAANVDLDALGQRMLARKEDLMLVAEKQGLPPSQMHTI